MTLFVLFSAYLYAAIVYEGARAKNQLWNELRSTLAAMTVLLVWGSTALLS